MGVMPPRTVRLPRLALTLLALALCCGCPDTRPKQGTDREARPAEGRGGTWRRPFHGHLPQGPPQGVTVLHVVDAVTRAPIRGARIEQRWEIDVDENGWAPRGGHATTDAFGLAWVHTPHAERATDGTVPEAHWTVHAPGYAATSEYGGGLAQTIELERPLTWHGRLVDALGRPLVGMELEYKEGCGHAPALVRTRTDRNGVFVLSGVDGSGDLFYAGRGVLGAYYGGTLRALDETPDTDIAEPAVRIEGRIVGAPIAALAPGMIHVTSEQRGVFARIRADGRFVVDGVFGDGLMSLWCDPLGMVREIRTDLWRPGHPFVWDVRPGAPDPLESETVAPRRVAVQVLDPDGTPTPFAGISAWRVEDGREADTDSRDGDEADPLVLALLPGTYDITLDPGARAHADPVRVTVGRDAPAPITIRTRLHPRLEVTRRGPDAQEAICDVVHADEHGHVAPRAHDLGEDPWVPAGVEACVRAYWDGRTTLHPIGPLEDGVRRVVVARPRVRTVVCHVAFEPEAVRFAGEDILDPERADGAGALETSFAFETMKTGRLALVIDPPREGPYAALEPIRRLLTIDDDTPERIELAQLHALAPQAPAGRLTFVAADGAPLIVDDAEIEDPSRRALGLSPWVERDGTDEHGVLESATLRPGCVVRFDVIDPEEGRIRHAHVLTGPGPWTWRQGRATLEVEVHGRWGLLMASSLMLDGRLRSTSPREGDEPEPVGDFMPSVEPARYVLRNLTAGPHVLIVTAPGHVGEARRLLLEDGETRRIRVELPERDDR